MNCELTLIEKYLKSDFPFIIKIREIVEIPTMMSTSGSTNTPLLNSYMMIVEINESFNDQLKNNPQLNKVITNSFGEKSLQIIKSVCPEVNFNDSTLVISFNPKE